MTRSLLELMDAHAELSELLARHRDRVVELRFPEAVEALGRFEEALRRHMDAEERHVLPLYEKRVGHVIGGDPEFFRLEHKNILRNLAEIVALGKALAADAKAGPRQAHEFLAKEGLLMHVLHHHDLREKNILYPELDRRLDETEREELLRLCGR
ncbi:MAG: hemerythrin domain-containing protein [Planctomycetes bacterium]|nr:hemerythrin domain-containing protein [Planctomycetota bacterium]